MNNYRNEVVKYNGIKDRLESKRQEIKDSGKTDEWKGQQLAELNEKTKEELKQWDNQVKQVAELYGIAGQEIYQEVRRKPAGKMLDAATLDLHRGLAKDAFEGLAPEAMLKAFGRVVSGLPESELGSKFIYEDTLKSLIRDESFDAAVEKTFQEYRTPYEQAARDECERRKVFMMHDSTIRGIAEMDIDAITHGNRPVHEDIGALHDEMMS